MLKVFAIIIVLIGGLYLFGFTQKQQIRTEVQIAAPPDVVWAVLTDFATYEDWNPFIQSMSGTAEVGEKLAAQMHPVHLDTSQSFEPTVLVADEERELRWLGHLLFPKIFDGEHYFLLEEVDIDGAVGTRFQNNENFTGILLLFFNMDDYVPSLDAMNAALKETAEAKAAS